MESSGSPRRVSIFATEHGKSSYEELSDEQVQDFATLLEGLWFPMHPNDMERNGKFGCQVCKDLYLEMFRAKVRPIAGNAKAGKQTDIDELPPEVLDKLIQKMDQHEKFLSGTDTRPEPK
jgi:hypothetical protein